MSIATTEAALAAMAVGVQVLGFWLEDETLVLLAPESILEGGAWNALGPKRGCQREEGCS
ncbi:MAG: hypothetical protein CSA62_14885 [Planctomycetota bacterium]|nr:MAG: hypothetical protein CSA62_14885 [Planctomycetota bacterium]